MQTGPYIKDHALFVIIKDLGKDIDEFMGLTYETGDSYAGIWFKTKKAAEAMRKTVNERIGWSILSKPEAYGMYDDGNPFTCDAVCVSPVPKDIADRNDKYDGDAMVGALMECIESGIEVRI